MKPIFQFLLAAVAVIFVSAARAGDDHMPAKAPVYADEPNGYIFAYGGFAFGHETDSLINLGGIFNIDTIGFNSDYDGSYILGGGVGIYSDFMNGSRFELEGLHSSKDLGAISVSVNGQPLGTGPLAGDLDTQAFFFNMVKEFPIGRMTGYVGGGFGVANTEWTLNAGDFGGALPFPLAIGGADTSLAYQFKAGVDVPVGERLSLFTEYKLLGVSDRDYTAIILPVSSEGYISHHVVFGARIDF